MATRCDYTMVSVERKQGAPQHLTDS